MVDILSLMVYIKFATNTILLLISMIKLVIDQVRSVEVRGGV